MNRGQRVWQELQNPLGESIAVSELLLLLVLKQLEGSSECEIDKELRVKWKVLNKKKPDFYIVWSTGYDLHNELLRFTDIGLIDAKPSADDEPLWELTSKGNDSIGNWMKALKAKTIKGYLNNMFQIA